MKKKQQQRIEDRREKKNEDVSLYEGKKYCLDIHERTRCAPLYAVLLLQLLVLSFPK